MLKRIILSDDELQKVRGLQQGVEIVDKDGNLIGVLIPQSIVSSGEASDEEIERAINEGKRHSTAEVLAFIESFPHVHG